MLFSVNVHAQTYPVQAGKAGRALPRRQRHRPDRARRRPASCRQALGQPFVVENKPGAQGAHRRRRGRARRARRLHADGDHQHAAGGERRACSRSCSYDPVKDFAPVARLGTTSFMLMVRPDFPAKNLKEFLALREGATRASSPAGYGSAGSQVSLAMLQLDGQARLRRGALQGHPAGDHRRAGRLAAASPSSTSPTRSPQMKGGKLRGLAVTSAKRTPARAGRAGDRRGAAGLRAHRLVRADGAGGHAEGDRAAAARGHHESLAKTEVKDKFAAHRHRRRADESRRSSASSSRARSRSGRSWPSKPAFNPNRRQTAWPARSTAYAFSTSPRW